jgi:hypothetical protein
MKRWAATLIAVICGVAPASVASIDPMPPLTPKTINGVWHGVSNETPSVFVMSLNSAGESYVSFAFGNVGGMETEAYKVTKLDVKNGKVDIKVADYAGKGLAFRVVGEGVAFATGEGTMRATVSRFFGHGNKTEAVTWQVEFILRPGGFIDHLLVLKKAAVEKMECERLGPKCQKGGAPK